MAQWTRHRLFSFSIESQRYVNYSKDKHGGQIKFIKPVDYVDFTIEKKFVFDQTCEMVETAYLNRLAAGFKAEEARGALSNDVVTTMIVTGNLRVWKDFLEKRTANAAQKEIRHIAKMVLSEFKSKIPVIFDKIGE